MRGSPAVVRFPHALHHHSTQVPGADAHLYMIGGGGLRAQVEQRVFKKGLRKRVTCTGALDAEMLHRYYRIGSVIMMPSRNEGLSISLLEAMSHGIVPIASPVGAQQEALEHAGFLETSIDAMAARLSALYRMPADGMRQLRQRSILAVDSKFSAASFESSWNASIQAPSRWRQVIAAEAANRAQLSRKRMRGKRREAAPQMSPPSTPFLRSKRNASSLQWELQDVCMDAQVHEGYHTFAQIMNQLSINAKQTLDYNIQHSSGRQEVDTAPLRHR